MTAKKCLICENEIRPFIYFGQMPIANGFLRPSEYGNERRFDLRVGHCEKCSMVQLLDLVDPGALFHENYAYFSSISERMAKHFAEFAEDVRRRYLGGKDPFVVEIGSNDGIMLQNFARVKMRHLGVEPSKNVADAARMKGINTISEFFNDVTAKKILDQYGPADAILGANVICHIPDFHSLAKGLKVLLAEKGVFVFEEPYLGDIIEKASYDQIYDEHVFYFCVGSLSKFFAMHDMEIIDVMPQETHGGSMRYVVARKGARTVSPAVGMFLSSEKRQGLDKPETYREFTKRVNASRDKLMNLLRDLKHKGKTVFGYGATSKSTTVTNFCGITPDLVHCITDTTPGKIGMNSPGAHIPIVPYSRFRDTPPDYALLFAWNHGGEIMAKEKDFMSRGGKFIVYVPDVEVIDHL
jgi:methylation protein EvaC